MQTIKDRLKLIRTEKQMSQEDFGKKIGLSRSQIGCYEKGIREITDRSLNDICREFNIRKEWLLEGTGEMHIIPQSDEALAEALAEITLSENEQLKQIVMKLSKLNDVSLDSINNLIDVILNSSTQ